MTADLKCDLVFKCESLATRRTANGMASFPNNYTHVDTLSSPTLPGRSTTITLSIFIPLNNTIVFPFATMRLSPTTAGRSSAIFPISGTAPCMLSMGSARLNGPVETPKRTRLA